MGTGERTRKSSSHVAAVLSWLFLGRSSCATRADGGAVAVEGAGRVLVVFFGRDDMDDDPGRTRAVSAAAVVKEVFLSSGCVFLFG